MLVRIEKGSFVRDNIQWFPKRKASKGEEDRDRKLSKSNTSEMGIQVSNYHRKALYGKLRPRVGEILRHLCRQKGRGLEEGKAMAEHIHMLLSVLPKYSIAILDI
jgi:hypothetical protein